MRRRFEINVSTKPRPYLEGHAVHVSNGRIKTFIYGFAALVLISIALVVGVTVGTAAVVTIGVLVLSALVVLVLRGIFDRIRDRYFSDKS